MEPREGALDDVLEALARVIVLPPDDFSRTLAAEAADERATADCVVVTPALRPPARARLAALRAERRDHRGVRRATHQRPSGRCVDAVVPPDFDWRVSGALPLAPLSCCPPPLGAVVEGVWAGALGALVTGDSGALFMAGAAAGVFSGAVLARNIGGGRRAEPPGTGRRRRAHARRSPLVLFTAERAWAGSHRAAALGALVFAALLVYLGISLGRETIAAEAAFRRAVRAFALLCGLLAIAALAGSAPSWATGALIGVARGRSAVSGGRARAEPGCTRGGTAERDDVALAARPSPASCSWWWRSPSCWAWCCASTCSSGRWPWPASSSSTSCACSASCSAGPAPGWCGRSPGCSACSTCTPSRRWSSRRARPCTSRLCRARPEAAPGGRPASS